MTDNWQDPEAVAPGTGDVVGPSSAVSGNFMSADGATGKKIQDSGKKAADFALAAHNQAISTISDATTVGQNLVKKTNPSAVTFLRINEDNTVDALSAADFRTAIGSGSGGGDGVSGKYYAWLNFGGFMGGP